MSGLVKSGAQFLGMSGGPQAPDTQNTGNSVLNEESTLFDNGAFNSAMNNYALGGGSAKDILQNGNYASEEQKEAAGNALATGATTGSRFATEQVENNPLLSGLYGKGGTMQSMENDLNNQIGQGWSLQPQDQTMYGQAAGNIARQYGQQGNQVASNLAARGLSSSGAAGAAFSGLAGNQNEMLAQAQQQIMQQRFQNTMSQANAINQMGQGASNAIQQQFGRQLSGAQQHTNALSAAASSGSNVGQLGLMGAKFNAENQPGNIVDMGLANLQGGSAAKAGAAGTAQGQASGSSGGLGALIGA